MKPLLHFQIAVYVCTHFNFQNQFYILLQKEAFASFLNWRLWTHPTIQEPLLYSSSKMKPLPGFLIVVYGHILPSRNHFGILFPKWSLCFISKLKSVYTSYFPGTIFVLFFKNEAFASFSNWSRCTHLTFQEPLSYSSSKMKPLLLVQESIHLNLPSFTSI